MDPIVEPDDVEKKSEPVTIQVQSDHKEVKKRLIIFLPILVLIVIALVVLIFFYSGKSSNKKIDYLKTTPTSIPPEVSSDESNTLGYVKSDFNTKKSLISSKYIDDVMKAITLGHIPQGVKVDDESFSRIETTAFKIDLSINDRHKKLVNYFNISEFPNTNTTTLTNNLWKGFGYSEGSDMYTKDGYACIVLNPNRFDISPNMSCANLLDLNNNTSEKVSSFIISAFDDVGIDCESENCVITETKAEYPLDKYGRDMVYFDETISRTNDNELKEKVKLEAQRSADFLETSDWQVKIQDYTETERKWNKEALISMLINAENKFFECKHEITVMLPGKRQSIECKYKNEMLPEVQTFYNPYK